jgi:hypothetical protein
VSDTHFSRRIPPFSGVAETPVVTVFSRQESPQLAQYEH